MSLPAQKTALLLAISLLASGCPAFHAVPAPQPAPGADTSEKHPGFYRHFFELQWDKDDLQALQALSIQAPAAIHIVANRSSRELAVHFSLDVPEQNHDELARQYLEDFQKASRWTGAEPELRFPPHREIRVGELFVEVPALTTGASALRLAFASDTLIEGSGFAFAQLAIALRATTRIALQELAGPLTLNGGGAQASARIEGISHREGAPALSVLSHLTRIEKLELNSFRGEIRVELEDPSGADVTLDGKPVTQFPFARPPAD